MDHDEWFRVEVEKGRASAGEGRLVETTSHVSHGSAISRLMRVRWTTDAADDLERICDFIAESRPESARRVAQSIVERVGTLESFPHLGRPASRAWHERSLFLHSHTLQSMRSLTREAEVQRSFLHRAILTMATTIGSRRGRPGDQANGWRSSSPTLVHGRPLNGTREAWLLPLPALRE